MSSSNESSLVSFGLLAARVPLGLYFAIAGYGKIVELGPEVFANTHLASATRYMPEGLAKGYLMSLPFIEVLVGATLVVGLLTRISAAIMLLLLVSFTIAFGLNFDASGGPPFNSNLVFAGLALLLVCTGGGRASVDGSVLGH